MLRRSLMTLIGDLCSRIAIDKICHVGISETLFSRCSTEGYVDEISKIYIFWMLI